MKALPLVRLLCLLSDEPQYRLAEALRTTPSTLSRIAAGIVRTKPDILKRAAAHFSSQLGLAVDSDVLATPVEAKALVATALYLRSQRLQKGIPA